MKQKPWCEIAMKMNKPYRMSKTTLRAHWIDISDATTDDGGKDWHIRYLKCSNCKDMYRILYNFAYCPNCGARMVNK